MYRFPQFMLILHVPYARLLLSCSVHGQHIVIAVLHVIPYQQGEVRKDTNMAPVGLVLHFLVYCFHIILPLHLLANYLLSQSNMAICVVVFQMRRTSYN